MGLFDQVDQAGDFVGCTVPAQGLEFLPGEAGRQMTGHIETLPPAVQDLEAGLGTLSRLAAIAEMDRAAQPGATHFKRIEEHSEIQNSVVSSQKADVRSQESVVRRQNSEVSII